MFSIITMASSTTKPVPIVRAIRDRLSRLKPASHMTANVPISDSGSAVPAITVADQVRRNRKTTSMTRPTLSASVSCTSSIEARMVPVRSLTMARSASAGSARASRGSSAWMRVTVDDDIGARLAVDIDHDRGQAVVPGADARVLEAVDDRATSRSSTGAPLR